MLACLALLAVDVPRRAHLTLLGAINRRLSLLRIVLLVWGWSRVGRSALLACLPRACRLPGLLSLLECRHRVLQTLADLCQFTAYVARQILHHCVLLPLSASSGQRWHVGRICRAVQDLLRCGEAFQGLTCQLVLAESAIGHRDRNRRCCLFFITSCACGCCGTAVSARHWLGSCRCCWRDRRSWARSTTAVVRIHAR